LASQAIAIGQLVKTCGEYNNDRRMGEIYMYGGKRGEKAYCHGMRLVRHIKRNPETELYLNLK
jgi:hypothetical protein